MASRVVTTREDFAEKLREIKRNSDSESAGDLAKALNITLDAMMKILRGDLLPNLDSLMRMLVAMGAAPNESREVLAMHERLMMGMEQERALRGSERSRLRDTRDAIAASNTLGHGLRSAPPRAVRPYVPKFGQPDPIRAADPAQLQQVLRAVYVWGGSPSLRELEKRSAGALRRSTISDMLRSKPKLPDYDRYIGFLKACGIDTPSMDVWVYTWRRLAALQESPEVASWVSGASPVSTS
ncbi:hypothetical protein GCM10010310_79160 [Streptomyces violaceolatus]|uniref:XRE family transcriptional regulator n=1 Tax=Streptomyces violaceolatus TaxID=67378 RepID=A0ABN3TKR5_9ACTN